MLIHWQERDWEQLCKYLGGCAYSTEVGPRWYVEYFLLCPSEVIGEATSVFYWDVEAQPIGFHGLQTGGPIFERDRSLFCDRAFVWGY
jgi:hypothetical protein